MLTRLECDGGDVIPIPIDDDWFCEFDQSIKRTCPSKRALERKVKSFIGYVSKKKSGIIQLRSDSENAVTYEIFAVENARVD